MKVVILGASGLLGTKLMDILSVEHEVIGTYLNTPSKGLQILDVTNKQKVEEFLRRESPDVVINTVALTSSVACERKPSLAKKLNYETAKNVSRVCQKLDAYLVFTSSSYVFDGKGGSYKENERPHPINQYGETKVMAEKEVLNLQKGLILRIDAIYGYNGKKKNNGILNNIFSNKQIFLGSPNQVRQPLLIDDLAGIIISLVKKKQKGIFNIAGPDKLPMLNFIKKLEKLIRKESKISILGEKNLLVKPLKNSTLDISKINKLGIKTHSLKDGLNIVKQQLISS
ncbi:SDR family oxidoreductase [archaeon]|nr:SDR family oxidoreductase [archaeon]MBT7128941.1 SDR family oxidoreductase [archaeon]